MADGFITRRGGGAGQFYEGTVELSAYWTEGITFDVGFMPRSICIARTTATFPQQTYHINLVQIGFNTNGEERLLVGMNKESHIYTQEAWEALDVLPTIERTATGVKITGSSGRMFSGTYTVIATA